MSAELFVGVVFLVVLTLMTGAALSYIELERERREAARRQVKGNDGIPAPVEVLVPSDE